MVTHTNTHARTHQQRCSHRHGMLLHCSEKGSKVALLTWCPSLVPSQAWSWGEHRSHATVQSASRQQEYPAAQCSLCAAKPYAQRLLKRTHDGASPVILVCATVIDLLGGTVVLLFVIRVLLVVR